MEQATPRRVTRNPQERTSRDRLLDREVRWRLFKEEEMPARLRRITRLERVARSKEAL
jgi:hypothetical protein